MIGSSRQSLATVLESVDSRRGATGFDALAGDLFAVADLLGRERSLLTALADSGQPGDARAALVDSLLAERISPVGLEIVRETVRARWSSDEDLLEALESAAAQAAFTVAEGDGSLDRVEEELFRFGRAVDASADLQMTLTDPALASASKAAVVRSLLEGRTAPATAQVLEYVAGHLRGRRADAAVADLSELAARLRERVVADVRVAIQLDEQQQQRLADALARVKGRKVQLNVAVDPSVIGGISVRVGDEVIDGTVAARLEQARRALAD